jgi:aspartyl-tRNA(Asn)/glutamyl-tRNA(Gln) amidotransferase subunit A
VSAASSILKGFVATYHATAVEKLLEEEAIIIGSLNCDEFAMVRQTKTLHMALY